MKPLLSLLLSLSIVFSFSSFAGQEEYDDCLLLHLKGAKLDPAAHLIKQACHGLHKQPSVLLDKKRQFYICLLDNLVGVESIQAITDINAVCGRKYK
jgi:hypothetical protein